MHHPRHTLATAHRWKASAVACSLSLLLGACATSTAGLNAPEAGDAQVPSQFAYAGVGQPGSQALLDQGWWRQLSDPWWSVC